MQAASNVTSLTELNLRGWVSLMKWQVFGSHTERERARAMLVKMRHARARRSGTGGGGCAAVRLHSVEAEITTLTCLDYWLDAAMSGVAATAVCFHRAGEVQVRRMLSVPASVLKRQSP